MASRSVQTHPVPIQIHLADGALFLCACKSNEFRINQETADSVHLFCKCGRIYTIYDLPPLKESL